MLSVGSPTFVRVQGCALQKVNERKALIFYFLEVIFHLVEK